MIKKFTSVLLSILLLASIVTCLPITTTQANAATSTQINIVKRADSLYSCTWYCESDVNGWADENTFLAGEEYHIPYGQPITSGEYIGFGVSYLDYLESANTADSIFYTTQSDYQGAGYPATSTYYATDCSAFASYCWGIARTTTTYFPNRGTDYGVISLENMNTLQLGDALNLRGSHVVLVTDLFYDGYGNVTAVEITEQTTPDTQRGVYTPEELIVEFEGYSIIRYNGTVTAPTFTLSFRANGGSGTMSNQTVVYDDKTTVTNKYTRNGYKFVGWAAYRNPIKRFYYTNGIESGWYKRGTQPEGWSMTILPADYNFGTIGYGVGDTVTMYALWQNNETGVIEAPGSVGYFPACPSDQTGFSGALASIGVDNSYDNRERIAIANGISDYSGTADQNTALFGLLKQGLLIDPDSTADEDDSTYETVVFPTEPPVTEPPVTEAPSETETESTEVTVPEPTESTPEKVVEYFPACDATETSFADALESIGEDRSFDNREIIAIANGITDYRGSEEQNTTLLWLLKQGLLIKPDGTEVVPEPTESTGAPTESTAPTETTVPEITEPTVPTKPAVPTEPPVSTNMALGKNVTASYAAVLSTSDVNYNVTAVNKALPKLVDGVKDSVKTWFNNDKDNVAFNKSVLKGPYSLTVDLGQGVLIDTVQLFAHERAAWNYFITDKVTYSVSTNGTDWRQIGEVEASETGCTTYNDPAYTGADAVVSIYNFTLSCKPIKARYVKATFPMNSSSSGIIAFNEFEVHGTPTTLPSTGGTNLASGKTVTATSTEELTTDDADYSMTAVNKALPQLVDGIKNNYNSYFNNGNPNIAFDKTVLTGPYSITVDLGAKSNVNKIALYNYSRPSWGNREPVDSVKYSVSADGTNWITLGTVSYEEAGYTHIADPNYTGPGADVYINDFALNVEVDNVRYVKATFESNSGQWVIFNEFEVYGKKASDTSFEIGDVSCNGVISINDVTLLQRILAHLTPGSDNNLKYGDVNLDDSLSIRDVTYIQMYIAKRINSLPVIPTKKLLDIPVIAQNPELPTGCEITSVTQMLRYAGANVEKTALAREMPYHDWDPNQGYVGNPFTSSGYTIYPKALLSLVKKYAGSAVDMSGCTVDDIKLQIAKGKPVVVWVGNFRGWNLHCILAVGYDGDKIILNDCSRVSRDTYSISDFEKYWAVYDNKALSY